MSKEAIRHLESEVHLDLPGNISLLKTRDGGGRDPQYNYHLWLIHSPDGLTISPAKEAKVRRFVEHQAPDYIAEWISSLLPSQHLPPVKDAASADWTVGNHTYRSELLRTEQGDYLVVQRFRVQPTKPSP